jgi:hypothetical protein
MKIAVNEQFNWNGTAYVVLYKDDDLSEVVIRNLDSKEVTSLSVSMLNQAILNLELGPVDIRPPGKDGFNRLTDLPANDPARNDAEFKLCYAKHILRHSMPATNQDEYLELIAERHGHQRIPRPSTARRWAQHYKSQGELALLDGRRLKQKEVAGMRP